MNQIHPTFTNLRSSIAYDFSALRMRALRDSFWAKLSGNHTELSTLPKQVQQERPNRKLIGARAIPLENIIGILGARRDFDHQFRPLKKHMIERWVNTVLALEAEGWSAILVHKVGEDYYVEDGHHRVSVARSLGMISIEAKIWEYSTEPTKAVRVDPCQPAQCMEQQPAKAYAAG